MRAILFCSLLFVVIACEETSEYPHDIPIVITEDVTPGKGKETELTATIKTLGTGHNVIAYGFVWNVRIEDEGARIPTLSSPHLTFMDGAKAGTFSHKVTSDFKKNQRYNLRAFLQTDKLTIYGNNVIFTAEEVPAMTITDFTPKSGFEGTEVTLTGTNLGLNASGASVTFGSTKSEIISASDTLLKFKVPVPPGIGRFTLFVSNSVNAVLTRDDFVLLGPRITSISPTSGKAGDVLTIEGEYFDKGQDLKVFWDGRYSAVPTIISPTKLTVTVPGSWKGSGQMGLRWKYTTVEKNSGSDYYFEGK